MNTKILELPPKVHLLNVLYHMQGTILRICISLPWNEAVYEGQKKVYCSPMNAPKEIPRDVRVNTGIIHLLFLGTTYFLRFGLI